MLLMWDSLQIQRLTQTGSKWIEKDILWKWKWEKKKAGIAILLSDKTDFKTRAVTGDKGGPRNSTSGHLPEENETLIRKDTCNPMFTAAILTIAMIWKQHRCSSVDEWIKKKWICVCTPTHKDITQPWKGMKPCYLWQHRGNYAKHNKPEKDKYCIILLKYGI